MQGLPPTRMEVLATRRLAGIVPEVDNPVSTLNAGCGRIRPWARLLSVGSCSPRPEPRESTSQSSNRTSYHPRHEKPPSKLKKRALIYHTTPLTPAVSRSLFPTSLLDRYP